MLGQVKLLPGTIVLNQDNHHPLAGTVVDRPPSESPADGFVFVHWADGRIEIEDPADLMLTAQLFIEIPT